MNLKRAIAALWAALCFVGVVTLLPGNSQAQDSQVKAAMEILRSTTSELGPPKIEGTDMVAGKQVPALYFGSTKMNNNNDVVDKVAEQAGGTATIFVKNANDYVRIATNVKAADGTRAIGTILDPKGKAIQSINKNEAFYGDVVILDNPYTAGYEPIRDASNQVIGILYVGYMK